MRALKRAPCPCDESAKTHTAPRRLRSAPTSRKHCGVCTVGERNADAPLAAGGSMVPRAPPAPSERQCANAALTGSGNISLPHIPRAPCRGNISTPCVPEERVVAIFRRDASPGCRPWQYFAVVRFRAAIRGKISLWCVFGRSPMAKCSRNTLPSVRPWQDFAVVRFRGSSRGEIMPRCVPGRRSVAAFSLHAFPKGPRTGKAPVRGNISPPCIQNELASARYARRASEKPCERAFGDARRADLAVVRRLNEKGSGKAKKLPAF